VTEIKNPDVEFEGNRVRHENFHSYTQKALNQVSNYEDDFLAHGTSEYITSRTGYKQCSPAINVDLIIGLNDNLSPFARKKLDKHYRTINCVTHDMKIKEGANYLERLMKLRVLK
jgi:hypothetical protein